MPGEGPTLPQRRKVWLGVEFVVLLVGVPALLAWQAGALGRGLLVVLWILAGVCLLTLLFDKSFNNKNLWRIGPLRQAWRPIVLHWVVGTALLAVGTYLLMPERFLGFVRQRPALWAMVMVLYPILSVLPQGLIYRAFLFHRYKPILPTIELRIGASALAFGYMHIIFRNPAAPLLTLVGGYLFARTYARTGSLIASSIEHALFGQAIFTLGLGQFFYHGPGR